MFSGVSMTVAPKMHKTKYSSLAQSVERMTVNHDVAGSSPARGAKNPSKLVRNHEISEDFLFEIHK